MPPATIRGMDTMAELARIRASQEREPHVPFQSVPEVRRDALHRRLTESGRVLEAGLDLALRLNDAPST